MRTSTPNLLSPTATGNIAGRGTWFERIDLFLTKEVLEDDFPICAPLRSNAEAIANNRCLAALPRKCHIFASVNPVDAQTCFARFRVRWPVATRFASTGSRRYQPLSSASAAPGQRITSPSPKTHGDACNHTTATGPLSRLVGAGGLAHQSPSGALRRAEVEAGIAWSCVRYLPVRRPFPRSSA
jgi:hypothetical protein